MHQRHPPVPVLERRQRGRSGWASARIPCSATGPTTPTSSRLRSSRLNTGSRVRCSTELSCTGAVASNTAVKNVAVNCLTASPNNLGVGTVKVNKSGGNAVVTGWVPPGLRVKIVRGDLFTMRVNGLTNGRQREGARPTMRRHRTGSRTSRQYRPGRGCTTSCWPTPGKGATSPTSPHSGNRRPGLRIPKTSRYSDRASAPATSTSTPIRWFRMPPDSLRIHRLPKGRGRPLLF